MLKHFKEKFIGDKAFYMMVLGIAVPIMIQNGITNFVNLLDNIMVGQLGATAMSGVSVVNQFIFIFNLLIFGAISAAGIFTAQFYGSQDHEGVRHTFRFKVLICIAISAIGIALFLLGGSFLIRLYLTGDGDARYKGQSYCFQLDKQSTLDTVNALINPYTRDLEMDELNIFTVK